MCNISSNIHNKSIIDIEPSNTELEIIVILNKVCQFYRLVLRFFFVAFQPNSISIFLFHKYTKIRELMQAIRENIEKMRIYMQTMSQSYQASEEKCKQISVYFFSYLQI